MEKIHIALCFDKGYLMPAGVVVTSVCENNKENQICFHLFFALDNGIDTDFYINQVKEIVSSYKQEYKVYLISKEKLTVFSVVGSSYISNTTYLRFFLADYLPLEIKKIIYLDCDLIVIDSLASLWNTDVPDDYALAAVVDACGTSPALRYSTKLPIRIPYFNAGVLLMNISYFRNKNLLKEAITLSKEHQFKLMDQDLLNYMLNGHFIKLSAIYNLQYFFYKKEEEHWYVDSADLDDIRSAIKEPVIVHFCSSFKPWHTSVCPYKELWKKYQNITKWSGLPDINRPSSFEDSEVSQLVYKAYSYDSNLFTSFFYRFYSLVKNSSRLKNKVLFMRIGTIMMLYFAKFLDVVYNIKQRKAK